MEMFDVEITGYPINDIFILKIAGEVNFFDKEQFDNVMTEAFNGYKKIIFDLRELFYINSTCISEIVKSSKLFNLSGVVREDDTLISEILDLLTIEQIMLVYSNMENAIQALSREEEIQNESD